jgi:hypothetical protein
MFLDRLFGRFVHFSGSQPFREQPQKGPKMALSLTQLIPCNYTHWYFISANGIVTLGEKRCGDFHHQIPHFDQKVVKKGSKFALLPEKASKKGPSNVKPKSRLPEKASIFGILARDTSMQVQRDTRCKWRTFGQKGLF